jgi:hypothetical protein
MAEPPPKPTPDLIAPGPVSLAGTWGTKFAKIGGDHITPKTTTYTALYNEAQLNSEKVIEEDNGYARFQRTERSGRPLIDYQTDFGQHTRMGDSMASGSMTASVASIQGLADTRTQRINLRNHTSVRRMNSMDAPVAEGRSGQPMAGLNENPSQMTCLGERFNNSNDPVRNSFANRSWLPYDDPALVYMRDGVPKAHMPNDVSLAIGLDEANKVKKGWCHGRQYKLTGGPMTRSGALVSGVFADAPDPDPATEPATN